MTFRGVAAIAHHIEQGMSPREGTIKAMSEVTGPVIGITMVLMAVFLPSAFLGGITGQLYRQFALTIAATAMISAINAVTLKPAQSARYLRKKTGPLNALLVPSTGRTAASRAPMPGSWFGWRVTRLSRWSSSVGCSLSRSGGLGRSRPGSCRRKTRGTSLSTCNCRMLRRRRGRGASWPNSTQF